MYIFLSIKYIYSLKSTNYLTEMSQDAS
jgi:hypothetical protein